jgi:hypothetical protein
MGIKGHKTREVVSVFDPAKNAYRDVSIAELRRQLLSLGFTEADADKKIAELVEKQHGPKED